MKKWLRGQPDQPATIDDLQGLLDAFVEEYNDHRPHRSLDHRATPTTVYTTRPKATPTTGDRDKDTHDRVRHDKVDKAGKITWRYQGQMYSIGIGRTHTGTRVIVLAQDLEIRIIDAATGELIRALSGADGRAACARTAVRVSTVPFGRVSPRHIPALPRHRTPTRPHTLKMKEGRTHIYWVRPSAMS